MLRRVLFCAPALILLQMLQPNAYGADPVRRALPSGSTLVASVELPGRIGWYAVTYHTDRYYLGVVSSTPSPSLRWHRYLAGDKVALTVPGADGVFQASVSAQSNTANQLVAFRLRGSTVESAIAGDPSGSVRGDEGITVHRNRFTVRMRDQNHEGSVKYRLVTLYVMQAGSYRISKKITVPDYPRGAYPSPDGIVKTSGGDTVLIRLEVAATEQQRQLGLMNRKMLDPDSGMIFVWSVPILESFWMDNTFVPLSIAFLGTNGKVQEIQDMQPLTTDLHTPALAYQYAVEVNQGYFRGHGIQVGDRIALHLTP